MKRFLLLTAVFGLSTFTFAENLLTPESSTFECEKLPSNIVKMWNDPTQVTLTSEESYRGKKALKVNFTKNLRRVYIYAPVKEYKAGGTYTISAFVKSPDCKSFTLYFGAWETLWKNPCHKFRAMPLTSDWRQVKMTVKLEKNVKYIGLLFYGGVDKNFTMYIDEVKLEPGTKASWSEPQKKNN